jgi:hypothetical protein
MAWVKAILARWAFLLSLILVTSMTSKLWSDFSAL